MYESFFGLARRPFAATPDPGCWFRSARYQAALDELLVCAEQGQGIGLLVAPAGTGKTLICERLIREIGEPFTSVLLRHATYNTRRGFLQTLLCELAQPYDKHTDQELRLGLAPVLRGLHQQGRALLVVVDEAHQLSETLLEELRILSDQAEDGQPIVRLILAGQFGLEEKLAHPALQALNQRVRAHVSLEPLTQAESRDYIDFRITWGGGRTAEIFTDEALDQICRAADGVPRCLNQLCDHALLLAYVNEQHPVTAETIAAALEDLRHLPLPWNLPHGQDRTTSLTSASLTSAESSPAESGAAVLEWEAAAEIDDDEPAVGMDVAWEAAPEEDDEEEELTDDGTVLEPVFEQPLTPPSPLASNDSLWTDRETFFEEPVLDRYTALDAGLEPPVLPAATSTAAAQYVGAPFTVTAALLDSHVSPIERLDAIEETLDALHADDELPDVPPRSEEHWTADALTADEPAAAVFEFGRDDSLPLRDSAAAPPPPKRNFRNLFTQLRRKQLGRA
jgi:type II secretory pathway predicted ATPase ExeA